MDHPPLPPSSALSEQQLLGPQLSEHRGKFGAGGWLWYLGGLLVVAGVFGVVKSINQSSAGDAAAMDTLWTALAASGIGIVLLIVPVLRWRQTVICYANGIVWHRLLGDKTVRRDELSAVSHIHHRGKYTNHHEVELVTSRGTVSIVGIDHPEQLANHANAWLRGGAFGSHVVPSPTTPWAAAGHTEKGGWTPPA